MHQPNARGFLIAFCASVMGFASRAEAPLEDARAEEPPPWSDSVQLVLDSTETLNYPRGDRLPLYLWPAMNPGELSDEEALDLVRQLNDRGIGLVCSWSPHRPKRVLKECLPVARAQKRLGVPININANALMYSFFDGGRKTAHITEDGRRFYDDTFGKRDMGCPFRLDHRFEPMRERFTPYLDAYEREGLDIGFVFADWEIDGPLEWNRSHEASKRCRICREHLPGIDDFSVYQTAMRDLRNRIQREVYAQPILDRFPAALVGNYAVYPHNGTRYWYDYFERYVPGQPAVKDQRAHYRSWVHDFEGADYTFAMPVVYPWSWTWTWYDFPPDDYRWVYNGLLVASNAGANTPQDVPIIPFVHWNTVHVGLEVVDDGSEPKPIPGVWPKGRKSFVRESEDYALGTRPRQMSPFAYRELLWHTLLRGADTFFLWCESSQYEEEVRLLHPVWAAAQEFGDFLNEGVPISFDVPSSPGTVISGMRLGDRVLVRRTDFAAADDVVTIQVDGMPLDIPRAPGECQILSLSP